MFRGKKIEIDENQAAEDVLKIIAKELKIATADAFAAIYIALIGKSHGPRAGMLLTRFGRNKVIERFNEVMK